MHRVTLFISLLAVGSLGAHFSSPAYSQAVNDEVVSEMNGREVLPLTSPEELRAMSLDLERAADRLNRGFPCLRNQENAWLTDAVARFDVDAHALSAACQNRIPAFSEMHPLMQNLAADARVITSAIYFSKKTMRKLADWGKVLTHLGRIEATGRL